MLSTDSASLQQYQQAQSQLQGSFSRLMAVAEAYPDLKTTLAFQNFQTQIEGSAIFGLSAAFGEKLTYKAGEPQQKNLGAYTLLRASQTPVVTVKVMPTDNEPGGIGDA